MAAFLIEGGERLKGTVRIGGSKNSALPILAASLLSGSECIIRELSPLTDITAMQAMLAELGVKIARQEDGMAMSVDASNVDKNEASFDLAGRMRASFLILGPLLARTGRARIPLPGGCAIGARPVELHIKGLSALGASICREHGYVEARSKGLAGAAIYLDFPSVGATENIMMAAVLAKGQTIIQNCAAEPEIVDLANFLNSMGAEVKGSGTDTIKINGVDSLHGSDYSVIPDRIEAGTFMAAAAITAGCVTLENVLCDHLKPVTAKLRELGAEVMENGSSITVRADKRPCATDIKTMPYPGFPTDMQAQFLSLLSIAKGTSVVIETIFENRFMHASELKRMGADIKMEGRSAVVEGVGRLTGSQVTATDLRAGAGLVLAGLAAKGVTELSEIHHIDRGYYALDEKLHLLGAKISRVS